MRAGSSTLGTWACTWTARGWWTGPRCSPYRPRGSRAARNRRWTVRGWAATTSSTTSPWCWWSRQCQWCPPIAGWDRSHPAAVGVVGQNNASTPKHTPASASCGVRPHSSRMTTGAVARHRPGWLLRRSSATRSDGAWKDMRLRLAALDCCSTSIARETWWWRTSTCPEGSCSAWSLASASSTTPCGPTSPSSRRAGDLCPRSPGLGEPAAAATASMCSRQRPRSGHRGWSTGWAERSPSVPSVASMPPGSVDRRPRR